MFCPDCGRELKDGAKFCPGCGKPLTVNENNKNSIINNQLNGNDSGITNANREINTNTNNRSNSVNEVNGSPDNHGTQTLWTNGPLTDNVSNSANDTIPINNSGNHSNYDENEIGKQKKKPILLWIGIIGVVLIAALIVSIVVITKASDNSKFDEKMDLGRKYISELDYEQAVLAFKDAIEIDPKNIEAYIELASIYSKMGDNKMARETLADAVKYTEDENELAKLNRFISEYSDTYPELVDKAKKLFEEGKTTEAITEYEKAIDLFPKEYAAYVGLFDVYVSEVKYTAAAIVVDSGLNSVESTSGRIQLETCRSKLNELTADTLVQTPTQSPTLTPEPSPSGSEGNNTEPTITPTDIVKTGVMMNIRQIDNSNYPEIAVYTDITDLNGNNIETIRKEDIVADEVDTKGKIHHVALKDVIKIVGQEKISINLVIDKSGSMSDYNSMQQVKNSVHSLIDYMELDDGDCMEIISFDDYVYLNQEFTSDEYRLKNAVDSLYPNGMTSLYDALYSALYQSYYAEGSKCVVAFTDGMENNSSYTYNDVANLARSTGIPVYIVGVGGEYDAYTYTQLAAECGGSYYSASRNDIESVLTDIYINLYTEQQDYYVLRYDTANKKNTKKEWQLLLSMSDTSPFEGECSKYFLAKADLSGAFSDKYYNVDYILPFSGTREVTEADLKGLTLAQLRIARNEIFARHGRQFKDALLNQWFYSKSWYLSINYKYSPDYFDKYNPNPLSKVENNNANFIKKYEEQLIASQDIFPNANIIELSIYDLALTKSVLKDALKQMKKYPDSEILQENIKKVQDAINTDNIKY